MTDGIIDLHTDRGRELGFTSDRFEGYLWKKGESITISFIVSKQRGNFRELVRVIHGRGWAVSIPTPLGRMLQIVAKEGYRLEVIDDDELGPVDIWTLDPPVVAAHD